MKLEAKPGSYARPRLSVERQLIGLIEEKGGLITFAQFMERALYAQPNPQLQGGYYTNGKVKFGLGGDFITSPELYSPYFGHGFTQVLAAMWEQMGRPKEFVVVEMGAGTGVLCHDILQCLKEEHAELYGKIKYIVIEISPSLIVRQKAALCELPAHLIQGSACQLPLGRIFGCFLSNELVDALPFHRVVADKGGLKEIYIGYENGSFYEVTGEVSVPHIGEYVSRFGIRVEEGKEFCVNLNALRWLEGLVQAMEKGFVITIDYGYATPDAISKRGNPSRFFGPRHEAGQFDITADVDFHALRVYGEELGLETDTLMDEVDYTSGFAGFPMGTRGTATKARYVLIQRKI